MSDFVLDALAQMYGHRFTSSWGAADLNMWQKIIFSFAPFIVSEALDYLITKDHEFMEFPPNPMQFRKICDAIKKTHAPRPTTKLTSPCKDCGKPGRVINFGEGKQSIEKVFCFDHWMEHRKLQPYPIELLNKNFPIDDTVDEATRTYNQMRRDSMTQGWDRQRYLFENE